MLERLGLVVLSPQNAFAICLLAVAVACANAETINLASFTLTQSTFANGSATSPDSGLTLVITGPNDGSGEPGSTDYVGTVTAGGIFQFDWAFSTLDRPNYESAGYLIDGDFTQLAAANGESGSVSVPVVAGSSIGFELETVDNTGGPGILTVSDFVAPDPLGVEGALPAREDGSFWLVLSALAFGLTFKISRRYVRLFGKPVGATMAAAACLALVQPLAAATQIQYTGTNVTGSLVLISTVNMTQQATALQTSALSVLAAERPPKFLPGRLRPPSRAAARPVIGMSDVLTPLAPMAAATTSSLTITAASGITGFNALSHLDQRLANNGNQFSIEPPSQSIAASTNYILEGVNDAIQVFYPSGEPALPAVLSSNQVFGLSPAINRATGANGVYFTDMRVFYDLDVDRWFIIQRDLDNDIDGNTLQTSHLYLAVSQTGDPTATYDIYRMETTNLHHYGCPCLADYPQVGADQYGLYISWNEFDILYSSFVDASILSLSKASLAGGSLAPTAYQFFIPTSTGYEFAITPSSTPPDAVNYVAAGGLEYFTSTLYQSSYDGGIALWAMINTSSLALSPSPVLTMVEVPTLSYSYPGVARQCPGPLPYGSTLSPPGVLAYLDGGDNRVQALSYASGRLYVTFQAGVFDQTGHLQVGGAFVVLSPTYRNGVLAATAINQGYLVVNGNNLLRPAIAVNPQGSGSITATLVGPDWYPSAVVIPFDTFSAPSSLQIAGMGTLPEDGFTGYPGDGSAGVARWGDYNTAVATSDGAIWMVAQYIGTFPRTTLANWNTYIARFQP
jgi:hypothetical protein